MTTLPEVEHAMEVNKNQSQVNPHTPLHWGQLQFIVTQIMTVTPSIGDRSATGKVKSSFINTTQCPTDLTSSTPPTLPNWPVS